MNTHALSYIILLPFSWSVDTVFHSYCTVFRVQHSPRKNYGEIHLQLFHTLSHITRESASMNLRNTRLTFHIHLNNIHVQITRFVRAEGARAWSLSRSSLSFSFCLFCLFSLFSPFCEYRAVLYILYNRVHGYCTVPGIL